MSVPVEVEVVTECPLCDCAVVCFVSHGLVDEMKCVNGCHTKYSDDQRSTVEQSAKDAAESERNEIQNREPDDE